MPAMHRQTFPLTGYINDIQSVVLSTVLSAMHSTSHRMLKQFFPRCFSFCPVAVRFFPLLLAFSPVACQFTSIIASVAYHYTFLWTDINCAVRSQLAIAFACEVHFPLKSR